MLLESVTSKASSAAPALFIFNIETQSIQYFFPVDG